MELKIKTTPAAATGTTKLAAVPREYEPRFESDRQGAIAEAVFIDEKHLLKILPYSRKGLFNLRRRGVLPWINAKGRRVIYHLPSVTAAFLRHQRGGDL